MLGSILGSPYLGKLPWYDNSIKLNDLPGIAKPDLISG